jgi:hypothetical protein
LQDDIRGFKTFHLTLGLPDTPTDGANALWAVQLKFLRQVADLDAACMVGEDGSSSSFLLIYLRINAVLLGGVKLTSKTRFQRLSLGKFQSTSS